MRVATLPRGVIQADGAQALGFLQGIVTNDLRPLEQAGPQAPPVYAAILTPKGKFLHDVFIYRHPELADSLLLEVDAAGLGAALQLLNRYKLRRPISFTDASTRFRVMAAWGDGSPPAGPWWRRDPRLADLGFRALVPAAEAQSTSNGVVGDVAGAGGEDYRAMRYRLGVAEGEQEIPVGQAAPLDFNLDQLQGVSYTKGCYVGQERNSFTHYRGVIRKRLMPVLMERMPPTAPAPAAEGGEAAGREARQPGITGAGAAAAAGATERAAGEGPSAASASAAGAPACGAEVVDAASGRSLGQVRGVAAAPSACDGGGGGGVLLGLAYLKLEGALAAAEGRAQLRLGAVEGAEGGGGAGGGWRVVPRRPGWWPAEWGREEWGRGRD